MAAHSSILAWRIPWTEEPGKLYSSWGHKESDMTEWLTHTQTDRHTLTVWEGARTGAASPHITRSAYFLLAWLHADTFGQLGRSLFGYVLIL